MSREEDSPALQLPRLTMLERIRGHADTCLALAGTLAVLGTAVHYENAAYADNSPVDLAITVGTQPDSNGNDPVTITNDGSECVLYDFHLSSNVTNGDSSSSTAIDDSSTLQVGSQNYLGIGPSAEGDNASINVYGCADTDETTPLVPATNFTFQRGYSAVIESFQHTTAGGAGGSTTGGVTTTTNGNGTSTIGENGTPISITTIPGSPNIPAGPTIPSIPPNPNHCVVPRIRDESLRQAAAQLVSANCRFAQHGKDGYANLSRLQKKDHLRLLVDGFALRRHYVLLKTLQPGKVLPLNASLYPRVRVVQK